MVWGRRERPGAGGLPGLGGGEGLCSPLGPPGGGGGRATDIAGGEAAPRTRHCRCHVESAGRGRRPGAGPAAHSAGPAGCQPGRVPRRRPGGRTGRDAGGGAEPGAAGDPAGGGGR